MTKAGLIATLLLTGACYPQDAADDPMVNGILSYLDGCIAAVDTQSVAAFAQDVAFAEEMRGSEKWLVAIDEELGLSISYGLQKVLDKYPKYTCDIQTEKALSPAEGARLSEQVVDAASERFRKGDPSPLFTKFETCGQAGAHINITAFSAPNGTSVGIGAFKLLPQEPDCKA